MSENNYKPDFYIVPSQIADDNRLQPLDWKLYGVIYWYAKMRAKTCKASNKTLAEKVGCSQSAIADGLTRLEKSGHIKRHYRTSKGKNRQKIEPLVSFKREGVSSNEETPHSSNEEQNNNIYIKNNIKDIRKFSSHYKKKILENARLTKKAKKKIATRLQEYSIDELKQAIDNFSADDWNMDNNAHRGMAWFCHSEDRIEQFLNLETDDNSWKTL